MTLLHTGKKMTVIDADVSYILRRSTMIKIGVFVLAGLSAQVAQAAVCPEVKSGLQTDVVRVNPLIDPGWPSIYFCKQNSFTLDQLSYKPSETQLLTGGSQVISMGDAPESIQRFPVSNTVNLAGFTPSQLNLNTLSADFPNSGGRYTEKNIFNFYTPIAYGGDCNNYLGENKYDKLRAYLRDHANIFQANGGAQTGVRSDVGNDLAIIKDIPISHSTLTGTPITADITFYHTNMGKVGQYFTGGLLRFCWVGVSTRMDIKTNTDSPKYSGDYVVDVGVLTQ